MDETRGRVVRAEAGGALAAAIDRPSFIVSPTIVSTRGQEILSGRPAPSAQRIHDPAFLAQRMRAHVTS